MSFTTVPDSMIYRVFSKFYQKHLFSHSPSLSLLGWWSGVCGRRSNLCFCPMDAVVSAPQQCHITFVTILSHSHSPRVWFLFLETSSPVLYPNHSLSLFSEITIILDSFPCHKIVLTTVSSAPLIILYLN